MRLLAIDTSTSSLSAALAGDGRILAMTGLNMGKNHSLGLLPLLDTMLKQAGIALADLDGVAVTLGPGSFTGLRIGLSTVMAWNDSLNLPLVGISTLEALAATLGEAPLVCPVLDARRDQVYTALFSRGQRLTADLALSPEELVEKLNEYSGPVLMGGDGLAPYREYFQQSLGQRFLAAGPERLFLAPSAAIQGLSLLAEGKTLTSRELRPVYLRLSEAEEKRLQQQAAETEEA